MVAGQPVVEASQHYPLSPSAQNNNNNDAMFCSAMPASASPQYEYYQPQPEYHQYASNGQQGSPDLCPAHTQLCTVHGDYGKPSNDPYVSLYQTRRLGPLAATRSNPGALSALQRPLLTPATATYYNARHSERRNALRY